MHVTKVDESPISATDRLTQYVGKESAEPSEKMIDAGMGVFREGYPYTALGDVSDREMVAEIYRQMLALKSE